MTSGGSHDEPPQVDLSKGADHDPDAPFDPYRFGRPDTPPPPEYAPPGYVPEQSTPSAPPAPPQWGYGQPGGAPPPPSYPTGPYPPASYGPPQYQPGGYPGYQPPQNNGKATAGMVLGILSIVFCWLTIVDLVLVVPAIVFSALGLGAAKQNGRGRGQAVAGMICAAVAVVLVVVILVFAFHIAGKCSGVDHGSGAYDRCVRNQI